MSEFLNDSMKKKYLLKLIPDLSVFDVVEKYFIDNNKTGIDKLFFYNPSSNSIEINFRRFIVRSTSNGVSITPSSSNVDYTTHTFKSGNFYYYIIIDEQNFADGFTISGGNNDVIGVCF